MATIINADNGTISGSAGLKQSSDASGVLDLQTNGTTAVTVSTGQDVSFTKAINTPNTFGFKNRIINGDMRIDQRNAGASINLGTSTYCVDRWMGYNNDSVGVIASQRVTDVPTGQGFTNSIKLTVSTAFTGYSTALACFVRQVIEGNNIADMQWGTANAKSFVLSFWVKSSLTGTFGGTVQSGDSNRTYGFTYTINSAATWEKKTINIVGDTAGTWYNDNQAGLIINFSHGVGTNRTVSTTGSWVNQFLGWQPIGTVQLSSTLGATWQITGVQLEKGNSATSFDTRDYGRELMLCQRYYSKLELTKTLVYATTTTYAQGNYRLPVTMRAAPTSIATNATNMNELYVTNITGTYVPSSSCDTDSVWVIATNTGGTAFTANRQYRFNTAGCSIDFSSEL